MKSQKIQPKQDCQLESSSDGKVESDSGSVDDEMGA